MQSNKMLAKHRKECSKFVSHVNLKMPSNKTNSSHLLNENDDSDDDEQDNVENDAYDDSVASHRFGRRWYYWQYYKDGTYGKYVERKYNTLKIEILNNKICSLTVIDWKAVNDRAKKYIKCGKARALKASGILKRAYGYEEYDDDDIRCHHIIALLLHCNYDNLQRSLGQTFRVMKQDAVVKGASVETVSAWDNVRARNREYANWSRLLREAVELYGITMRDHRSIKLYHGIDCELVFESIYCRFCAPTSMSTKRSVAQFFSPNNGLILQLTIYDFDLHFFDVSWLSNHPRESERLFIGGHSAMRINSIALSRLGHNYKHYMAAIGIIQNMFDARAINSIDQDYKIPNRTINVIKNLFFIKYRQAMSSPLFYEVLVKIPQYIRQLWFNFCNKRDEQITVDITKFNKSNEYRQFKQSLTVTV
eukprot:22899_1